MEGSKFILPLDKGNPTPPPPALTELVIGTDKYNVNATGDAVDDKGTIIKTKVELETLKTAAALPGKSPEEIETEKKLAEKNAAIDAQLIEGAEIELDDKKYKLNKDGAAVDETGKVIKTKAELKALLLTVDISASSDVDYVSEIQKITNLTIVGDNNQPVTYENTLPGITKYVQDVHQEGRKLGATEYEQNLFSKFPILQDVIEHITINGNLDNFVQKVDYNKISVTDDETQQIDLFTRAKLAQGVPQTEINDLIGYYKTDKKLKLAAETGLTYLKTKQTEDATIRANQIATAKAAEDLQKTNYWNEVNKVLVSKQLVVGDKKFAIPEVIKVKEADGKIVTKTIKDFQDYIQKPLTFKIEGKIYTMTQLEYDEAVEDIKRTPHHDLFDAYRKFTKYDDSQFIAASASQQAVKQIIKLTTKAGGGGSGAGSNTGKLVLPIK